MFVGYTVDHVQTQTLRDDAEDKRDSATSTTHSATSCRTSGTRSAKHRRKKHRVSGNQTWLESFPLICFVFSIKTSNCGEVAWLPKGKQEPIYLSKPWNDSNSVEFLEIDDSTWRANQRTWGKPAKNAYFSGPNNHDKWWSLQGGSALDKTSYCGSSQWEFWANDSDLASLDWSFTHTVLRKLDHGLPKWNLHWREHFIELACSQGVKEPGGPFAFYRNPYPIVSRKKIEIVICQYLSRILLFLSF